MSETSLVFARSRRKPSPVAPTISEKAQLPTPTIVIGPGPLVKLRRWLFRIGTAHGLLLREPTHPSGIQQAARRMLLTNPGRTQDELLTALDSLVGAAGPAGRAHVPVVRGLVLAFRCWSSLDGQAHAVRERREPRGRDDRPKRARRPDLT